MAQSGVKVAACGVLLGCILALSIRYLCAQVAEIIQFIATIVML
ncbi:MAG: hypothetical protein SNI70_11700 [Rikenellaceae bacterium]